METKTLVKKLQRTCTLLVNHRNAYYRSIDSNRGLSQRMYDWIDFYNDQRGTQAWKDYCALGGFDLHHDALDNFA
jgi:hypothetical protein